MPNGMGLVDRNYHRGVVLFCLEMFLSKTINDYINYFALRANEARYVLNRATAHTPRTDLYACPPNNAVITIIISRGNTVITLVLLVSPDTTHALVPNHAIPIST